jgi:hypothetical protein
LGVFNVVRELAGKVMDKLAIVREVMPNLLNSGGSKPSEDTVKKFGRVDDEDVSV